MTFRKLHPVFYLDWRGRWATLREFLEGEYGLPLDRDVPPEPVRYAGEYDPGERVARGVWRIEAGALRFRSRGQVLAWEGPVGSGTWFMRRLGG